MNLWMEVLDSHAIFRTDSSPCLNLFHENLACWRVFHTCGDERHSEARCRSRCYELISPHCFLGRLSGSYGCVLVGCKVLGTGESDGVVMCVVEKVCGSCAQRKRKCNSTSNKTRKLWINLKPTFVLTSS